ncbi:MAG: pilus assembly protein N-terminal domain-containing protein [bacterium]
MKTKFYIATIMLALLCSAVFADEARKTIEIFAGETMIMRVAGLTRLAIGNPDIADVSTFPEKPDEFAVNAKRPGVTSLATWDASGDKPSLYEITVSSDSSRYERLEYPLKHYTLKTTTYNGELNGLETKADAANVANLQAMLTPILGANRFSVDVNRNRVLMQGSRADIAAAASILDEIDKPLRQIMIEAKVIEMTKDDLKRLGAMLSAQKGSANVKGDFTGDAPSFNAAFDTFSDLAKRFTITLDMLRTASVGRTLVSPKISVLDGNTAWILAGEKYPVATRDSEKGLVSFNYINTGIILAVTPRVGHDRSITLWLKPEVSNISGWVGDPQSSSNNAAPIISTREAMSEVRVQDGETVMIGGLQKNEETMTNSKTPGLGDLPVIGKLFRKKRTTNQTNELVIVITTHIIDNNIPPDLSRFGFAETETQPGETK